MIEDDDIDLGLDLGGDTDLTLDMVSTDIEHEMPRATGGGLFVPPGSRPQVPTWVQEMLNPPESPEMLGAHFDALPNHIASAGTGQAESVMKHRQAKSRLAIVVAAARRRAIDTINAEKLKPTADSIEALVESDEQVVRAKADVAQASAEYVFWRTLLAALKTKTSALVDFGAAARAELGSYARNSIRKSEP